MKAKKSSTKKREGAENFTHSPPIDRNTQLFYTHCQEMNFL
nr:MAG TPA: hypothetical protein [Caudoviricetes sp.]